jgi:hypothetical protein
MSYARKQQPRRTLARRDAVVFECLRLAEGGLVTDRYLAKVLVAQGFAASNSANALHIAAMRINRLPDWSAKRVRSQGYCLKRKRG